MIQQTSFSLYGTYNHHNCRRFYGGPCWGTSLYRGVRPNDYGYKFMRLHCHMTIAYSSIGERSCHLTNTVTNTTVQSCTFIGMKHISPTFMGWQHLRKHPPNVISPIFFCYFYFALGLHPWLCCISHKKRRPAAARDSFIRVHHWCMAWLGAPAPQTVATPVTVLKNIGSEMYRGRYRGRPGPGCQVSTLNSVSDCECDSSIIAHT